MSHHPSTAELAAFRRSIRPAWYARTEYPADLTGLAWPSAPLDHEPNGTQRRWGIPCENGMRHIEPLARRRAGVLRSRAYVAMDPGNYWLPRASSPTAAHDELAYGVPTVYRDCECCGMPAGVCECYGYRYRSDSGTWGMLEG